MMPHIAMQNSPSNAHDDLRGQALILIRVPALAGDSRASWHSDFRAAIHPRATVSPRRGRRLRREIRVAASAMIFAIPMSWALMAFAKIGPDPSSSVLENTADAHPENTSQPLAHGPRVTITLEPSAIAYPPDDAPRNDIPTVMPAGYLVPDDGEPEETAHAGN